MKPCPATGSTGWARVTVPPSFSIAATIWRSMAAWAGSQFLLAAGRRSPLATRWMGIMDVSGMWVSGMSSKEREQSRRRVRAAQGEELFAHGGEGLRPVARSRRIGIPPRDEPAARAAQQARHRPAVGADLFRRAG